MSPIRLRWDKRLAREYDKLVESTFLLPHAALVLAADSSDVPSSPFAVQPSLAKCSSRPFKHCRKPECSLPLKPKATVQTQACSSIHGGTAMLEG